MPVSPDFVRPSRSRAGIFLALALALLSGCGGPSLPPLPAQASAPAPTEYKISQGDTIQVSVWRSPELSPTLIVRPDGRITTPLAGEIVAAGLTSNVLAETIKEKLTPYVTKPVVSVIVSKYSDPLFSQVRAIGEVMKPANIPYRENMTLMDVLIVADGLTRFADGNGAVLVREVDGQRRSYSVRLDDLLKRGDITANAAVLPGDVIVVPRGLF
jgi:polysaccharide biosynthesis/export protein